MRGLLSIVMAAVSVALFSFGAFAQEVDVNKGIDLYKQAVEAYQNKQFDQAIQSGNDAHKIAVDAGEDGAELKSNLETLIPQLYYGKAANLAAENQFTEAIEAFKQAKAIAEKYNSAEVKENVGKAFPQLYLGLGKSSFDAGDFDTAIAHLTKAAELDPNNSSIYLLQGVAYMKKSDMTNAETAFSKCVEVGTTPDDESNVKNATAQLTTINLLKAQNALKAKKWSDAYAFADKSLTFSPDNTNGLKMKGMAAANLKKWDDVIDLYSKLADADSKEKPAAYYNIAAAYEAKNNKAKACEFYKKLLNDATYKAVAEHKVKVVLKCN